MDRIRTPAPSHWPHLLLCLRGLAHKVLNALDPPLVHVLKANKDAGEEGGVVLPLKNSKIAILLSNAKFLKEKYGT